MNNKIHLSVFSLWFFLLMLGLSGLTIYSHTPSQDRLLTTQWNTELMGKQRDGYSLVYFIHPECPCTLASTFELQRILQNNYPDLTIINVIQSADTSIQVPVNGISLYDPTGRISQSLGINTSGHVILYDEAGQALYSGGVTPARGHRGSNFGSTTLTDLLSKELNSIPTNSNIITFFTYGCKLNKNESRT